MQQTVFIWFGIWIFLRRHLGKWQNREHCGWSPWNPSPNTSKSASSDSICFCSELNSGLLAVEVLPVIIFSMGQTGKIPSNLGIPNSVPFYSSSVILLSCMAPDLSWLILLLLFWAPDLTQLYLYHIYWLYVKWFNSVFFHSSTKKTTIQQCRINGAQTGASRIPSCHLSSVV